MPASADDAKFHDGPAVAALDGFLQVWVIASR
jgi:hypothetical protein